MITIKINKNVFTSNTLADYMKFKIDGHVQSLLPSINFKLKKTIEFGPCTATIT
jgi:hypothetical protein